MKQVLRIAFFVVIAAAATTVVRLAPRGVDSDIVSLLFPSGETLLSALTENSAKTINVLFEGKDEKTVVDSASEFSSGLRKEHSLKDTLAKINKHKDGLLSSEVRSLVLSNRTDVVARSAEASIFGFSAPLFPVKEDPFFLASSYITDLQSRNASGWNLENGIPVKTDGTNCFALVTLDSESVSPMKILEKAETTGKNSDEVKIWAGGAPIHSAISESSAKKEINILSAASITLCLALGFLLLRTFKFIPFLLLSLACSFTVSAASLFLFFDRPHVLALVFGTSLTGLSVDYTYHTFASRDDKTAKHLTFALLTTIACFSPLFFSSASILRQMALFTVSGLVAMYSAVILFGFDLKPAEIRSKDETSVIKNRPYLIFVQILLALFASAGLFKLKTGNDPRLIYKPAPFLLESEKRIAEAGGQTAAGFVAVKGDSIQDALEREERNRIRGISAIVPSLKTQRENFLLKKKLYDKELKNFTARTGIKPDLLPLTPSFLTPEDLNGTALEKLVKTGLVKSGDSVYLVSPAQKDAKYADNDIVTIEPRKVITDAFDSYTVETVKLISLSFAVLAALLTILFRGKVPRYVLPTAAGVVSTLGALGWAGETLNFFHALCLFVFIGLGLDYTIFHLSNRSTTLHKTVFFSFLTSLAGLGMLAFTSFSVTRSMGITLAFGLFFCYFFSIRGQSGSNDGDDSKQWFERKEQSAGKLRIMILWFLYSIAGKHLVKIVCIPVVACICPFAAPAKRALEKFYAKLAEYEKRTGRTPSRRPSIFRHLLGFAWSMVDKTDACTLAKNPPEISFRGGDSERFISIVESGKGAMIISSHLGTIEVLPCAKSQTVRSPHVHAFKQLGHNSIFTEMLSSKLDRTKLTVHPTEEIGVETAVLMKEAIARGDLVIMAGDRLSAGNADAFLPQTFMGEECRFPKGVYVFAKLMEAPVFFITCVRTGWNKYEIHVKEYDGNLQPKKILSGFASFLESETLARPSEWFHFHDFFMQT